MQKRGFGLVGVILVILVLGLIWGISANNKLVGLDEGVKSKYGQIETMIQRRADLIPNYVETVKGYASHESDTLIEVTKARGAVNDAIAKSSPENPNTQEISAANDKLSIALNAVVEAYPELKANENFMALQDELTGAENRIAKARKDYNDVVETYNQNVRRFPTSIVASLRGFKQRAYFEASEGAKSVPKVDFKK